MAWLTTPPDETVNVQDYDFLVQCLKCLREKYWFRKGDPDHTLIPTPTPTPTPAPIDTTWPRRRWPDHSERLYFGTVGTFSDKLMIDPDAIGVWDNSSPNPFTTADTDPAQFDRGPYSLIVQLDADNVSDINVKKNVRFEIQSIDPDTGSLTLQKTRDVLTSKKVAAYSDLVGKHYFIIPRYGRWWHERWPVPPTDQAELFMGIVDDTSTPEDRRPTVERLLIKKSIGLDYSPFYPGGKVDGISGAYNATDPTDPTTATHELMVWGNESIRVMHRVPIKTASGDEITYWNSEDPTTPRIKEWIDGAYGYGTETPAWKPAPGDTFIAVIIPRDVEYWLDTERHAVLHANRGAGTTVNDPFTGGVFSHAPDDTLKRYLVPLSSVRYVYNSDPTLCEITDPTDHDVGFRDAWVESDNACFNPNMPLSVDFWKGLVAVDATIAKYYPDFVEDKSYSAADSIPHFVKAEFFRTAAVNFWVGTISSVTTTQINLSGATLYTPVTGEEPVEYPLAVSYAIRGYEVGSGGRDFAVPYISGVPDSPVMLTDANTIPTTAFDNSHGFTDDSRGDMAGKTIVLCTDLTRFVPLEVERFYRQDNWIPDENDGTVITTATLVAEDQSTYDMIGNVGRGVWTFQLPSSTYTGPSALADGTLKTFEDGQKCRYVGNSAPEPVPGGGTPASFPMDPKLTFYDHYTVAVLHDPWQSEKVLSKLKGTATGGSTKRFECLGVQDWYEYWHSTGTTHVEAGHSSAGTTTSLDDSTKKLTKIEGAYWEPDNFIGREPYERFTIRIKDGSGNWHYRLITHTTGSDTDGVHVEWEEELPFTPDDADYEIDEPFELNRWQGHPVLITNPGGTPFYAEIFANWKDGFFPKDPFPESIQAGATFEILHISPGGVYEQASEPPTPDATGRAIDYVRTATEDGDDFYWIVKQGSDVQRLGVTEPQDFQPDPRCNLPTIVRRFGWVQIGDYVGKTFRAERRKLLDALSAFKAVGTSYNSRLDPAVAENNHIGISTSQAFNYDTSPVTDDVLSTAVNRMYARVLSDFQTAYSGATATVENTSGRPQANAGVEAADGTLEANEIDIGFSATADYFYLYVSDADSPIVSSSATVYLLAWIDGADSDPGQTPSSPTSGPTGSTFGGHAITALEPVAKTAFSDMGTGLVWRKYSDSGLTLSAPDAVTRVRHTTGKVGSPSLPPIPGEPPYMDFDGEYGQSDTTNSSGFYVADEVVVVKATGFTFNKTDP